MREYKGVESSVEAHPKKTLLSLWGLWTFGGINRNVSATNFSEQSSRDLLPVKGVICWESPGTSRSQWGEHGRGCDEVPLCHQKKCRCRVSRAADPIYRLEVKNFWHFSRFLQNFSFCQIFSFIGLDQYQMRQPQPKSSIQQKIYFPISHNYNRF